MGESTRFLDIRGSLPQLVQNDRSADAELAQTLRVASAPGAKTSAEEGTVRKTGKSPPIALRQSVHSHEWGCWGFGERSQLSAAPRWTGGRGRVHLWLEGGWDGEGVADATAEAASGYG